MFTLKQRILSR